MESMEEKDMLGGITFKAPVTIGSFVKVESGATYIKNNLPNVTRFSERDEDNEEGKKPAMTDDRLREMINRVMPKINSNRHWFCVVKVLMLRGHVAFDDFEAAKVLLDRLYPAGYPNPFDPHDLKKLHDGCFRLPLKAWELVTSPFKRPAEFKFYHGLATEFDALFE